MGAAYEDGTTLTVKGEGGDVFDMDVPPAGTFRREHFDDFVEKGWLRILGVTGEVDPEAAPPAVSLDGEAEVIDDEGLDVSAMKKADLLELAAAKGIEVDPKAKVDEIREALVAGLDELDDED